VTVMTLMDENELMEAGYDRDVESLVGVRSFQAKELGMGGIVCSAHEASLVHRMTEGSMAIVTPGIRPKGADIGDQKRVVTPKDALEFGSTHLVIGRPIYGAKDPEKAVQAIVKEMASADLSDDEE
ncbi:MAG: orotidine 5'-phosphate decarboxylase, partial [Devosiaceae bacterium]|nr:orotidine 5'-phosphate decarboxylase [Devosiaceae bacterium]